MRTLTLVALVCAVLAVMLHSTNAQMPQRPPKQQMPGTSAFASRARRAAQGGGGGADGGAGAGAGMGFGMGANMGGGAQGGGHGGGRGGH
ncbi:PREDICTED: glycine-rich cell wall structural protein-like [Rhagoletis zephyria]|uniref:glycine-rich cell wall structural protein-like n=1 Tax=Rhagoletis zephyria TaxID=28612 RepID=UPI000811657C|nr:PREDICTED: glycine-rich cell wall structural protein-like [Rhagoletis zephyria]XP_017479695.1 PREDICTED: glycine-rich cell wall structural protein-like [Rhagoletis zephyria]